MIKVCHILNLITGQADGVFTHLKMIFENYDKNKFEHFVIFQGGEIVEGELQFLGIKFYKVSSLTKKFTIRTFKEIFSILKIENPQILHAHLIKSYAIVGLINIVVRKKLIFNYNGLFINTIYYGFWEKSFYRVAHS